jgi:hypothetical protein
LRGLNNFNRYKRIDIMDANAIGPVEKNQIQVDSKLSSLGGKVPSGGTTSGQQTDTVELSQRGQAAVSQQVPKNAGSELRKIDITDDNQVVVKIVDGQTQKVVRQIPREEEMRLKQAMKENLDDLGGSSSSVRVDDVV